MNETTQSPDSEGLITKRTWVDELSWYCMVMGFIGLLLAGLCFFFYRNRPLVYSDFSIDANVLGKYLLMLGMASYAGGRAIFYARRYQRRRLRSTTAHDSP
jgi:hypothetical protein